MQFKEFQTEQKLRGGYYTPLKLASFIAQWVLEEKAARRVLEPSCGDGVFFEAAAKKTRRRIEFVGFETNREEARKGSSRCAQFGNLHVDVKNTDFLAWAVKAFDKEERFDGVLGNPPFIRYQYLPKEAQAVAEQVYQSFGLPFRKHTNAWVPFVIASIGLLRPGGRFGMVLPAEILHVIHAQAVRYFLGKNCSRILIFDPEDLWFENTLQGAVILLAEKKVVSQKKSQGLGIVRTKGMDFLRRRAGEYFAGTEYANGRTVEGKWTRALLTGKELEVLEGLEENARVFPFAKIAEADVGVVTGANAFFLVPDSVVTKYELQKWSHPMFGRSEHCPGIIYDMNQHRANAEKGLPTNFVWFDVASVQELNAGAKRYVTEGERQKLNGRYKCRIRSPWFKVPSVYATQIGMLKRAHNIPRLILNDAGAYTTDTAYRIKTTQVEPEVLVACFINSLTALTAELEGRHYGGGVLELVPSEIDRLLIPVPRKFAPNLTELDAKVRTTPAHDLLKIQDNDVLGKMGLSRNERLLLLSAWYKLRCRRQRVLEN